MTSAPIAAADEPGRAGRARGAAWFAGAALLYTALALAWSSAVWADPTRVIYGHGGDEQLTMSFFALVQHAVGTVHNPFFTTYLNAPHGVNLAWETTSPLLALVAWPFDAAFGPLLGFNLLCLAGFVLSGLSAYMATSRLVHSRPAGLVGGLLYAFSPFLDVHGGLGQLQMGFMVTPPLLALSLHALLAGDPQRWRRHAAGLAAVVVVQFYISIEGLFIEALAAAVVVLVTALANRSAVRAQANRVLQVLGLAAAITLACTGFALFVMFTYPYRPVGAVQPSYAFTTDALNLVVPTSFQLVGLAASSPVTSVFDTGNLAEATSYIGIAMLVICLVTVVRLHRNRLVVVAAVAAAAAVIASCGSHLHIAGHILRFPMPWALVSRLPIFQDVLPARFFFVVDFAMALLAAALIADVIRRGSRAARVATACATALAMLAFVPSALLTNTPPQPRFFTGDAGRIRYGSTVLIAPLPFDSSWNAELWQADAGVRFRIMGGYIVGEEANRPATIPTLATAMQAIELGKPVAVDAAGASAMRQELRTSGASTVVLGPAPYESALRQLLASVCNATPTEDEGVEVWWTC